MRDKVWLSFFGDKHENKHLLKCSHRDPGKSICINNHVKEILSMKMLSI